MVKPPAYEPYVVTDNALSGFSSIAPSFWTTAEKLRDDAVQLTSKQSWPTHWSTHSAICLYHAALECFINEEIALRAALTNASLTNGGYQIQGMTLRAEKLQKFFSYCGVARPTPDAIQRRCLLLINLRNRLVHHWPIMRGTGDYPVDVIDALNDAHIERVDTSWAAQCSDVRIAKWAAEIVRAFVDEWWRIGRIPGEQERAGWEFGPVGFTPPPGREQ
jgi:hypothetical protein